MPLEQGSSEKTIEDNTRIEVNAGKDPKQAYAIAEAMARRYKKLKGK